ncbi:hypothetical protein L218DRAFT_699805 [Marasmius fiardii PR-910]|nr:hypothetical protein L218DRAFT_699805 [Marasmius fiardii PR-910]
MGDPGAKEYTTDESNCLNPDFFIGRREIPDPSQNPVTTIFPPPSSPSNVTDAHGSDKPQSPLSSPPQEFFRELIPGLFERRTGQPTTSNAWESFLSEVKEGDDDVEDVGWDNTEDLDLDDDNLVRNKFLCCGLLE